MGDTDDIRLDIHDRSRGRFNPDEEFGAEFGYGLIKALRGSSIGRQTRRCLFWLGMYKFLYGIPIFVLACYEDYNLNFMPYFTAYSNGSSLMGLQYGTSFLALFTGTLCWLMVKYWSSMVTNRDLLVDILKVYQAIIVLYLILVIVTMDKVFTVFKDVDWNDYTGKRVFPIYIITAVSLFPYFFALLYYGLDMSFLAESIMYGGNIREPGDPSPAVDFSDLTLLNLLMAAIALPFMALEQCKDKAVDLYEWSSRNVAGALAERRKKHQKAAKARKSFFNRITKTFTRVWTNIVGDFKERKKAFEDRTPLAGLTDVNEMLEADMAQVRLQALIAAREAKEASERAEREAKEKEQRELEMAPTLSARMFKQLWGNLESSGSFQCKLKADALQQAFVEHLRKQGFHVVFVSNPQIGGFEVGVCNVRENGEGAWFLARFLSNARTFSAVMKCQDPSIVTGFVKKFALARVLRIDTTAS